MLFAKKKRQIVLTSTNLILSTEAEEVRAKGDISCAELLHSFFHICILIFKQQLSVLKGLETKLTFEAC